MILCYFCKLSLERLLHRSEHRCLKFQRSVERHPYNNCCRVMRSLGPLDKDCWDILSKGGYNLRHLNPVMSIVDGVPPNRCCCCSQNWVDKAWNTQLYLRKKDVNATEIIWIDGHLPGTTKAANPKIFFNPVIPRIKGKKRSNLSLKSFKMISIGINIFLILCLTKVRKGKIKLHRFSTSFTQAHLEMVLSYPQWHRAHQKFHQ